MPIGMASVHASKVALSVSSSVAGIRRHSSGPTAEL